MQRAPIKQQSISSAPTVSHSCDIREPAAGVLPAAGYVRLPVVVAVSGLAKSTIWKWCADGRFPKPRKLGPRVSAWPVAEVRAWLADPEAWQAKQRDNGEGM
ncbi:helix-turn-helix transcriptional regulator [Ralstonia mannitolilytica]|jgi:predicted DNA-binding transcriptional regulator AlpA|uniref:helix-turn-helix transcriptional regulator n=1 Tax=Ralstonia mannitolilytica TaxID=105219 RepID=UPI0029311422|nr:AlpA family phage regulatory protein [Ralstonia mannitolilytica]